MPLKDIEARREYDRERKRAWYENLSGHEHSERMLKTRRHKALARRKKRDQRNEEVT